ncbi:MAG: HD domain-containing protein [Bacteroidaceae bacterium]|nr:HD domain-containing protein [Bacteroidaceae bacterium]
MNPELRQYIEQEIIPRYDDFDFAHRRDHVLMVIRQSVELAERLELDADMAFAIAAYHDTGLSEGREVHHLASGRIIREDQSLKRWFTEEQIEVMAQAAEDHRASSGHPPRSIYGRIVAEADRFIDPETIVRRTVQYGLEHYPEFSREEHFARMLEHLHEKYGRGGYLKLWFEDSPNAARLERLRLMMDDEELMRQLFDNFYSEKESSERS